MSNTKNRLNVAELIAENPNISNASILSLVDIKESQIGGVRKWLTQKGVNEYVEFLKAKLATEKQTYKVGNFTNKTGNGKNKARRAMTKAIKESGVKKGTILTLPSTTWSLEKMIRENVAKAFNFLAVENDFENYVVMRRMGKNYGRGNKYYEGEIGDKILGASEGEYAHMMLDYCGQLETYKKEIVHAIMNNLVVVGGTIAVTVGAARDGGDHIKKVNEYRMDVTGEEYNVTDNYQYITTFFEFITALSGFEMVQTVRYADTYPMMLVIIKRTK